MFVCVCFFLVWTLGNTSLSPLWKLYKAEEETSLESYIMSRSQDTASPITPCSPKKGEMISSIQLSRPFLTRLQIEYAQSKTIDNIVVYKQRRNQVFSFLIKVCNTLKFPTRTLETAMIYYQRFYLHNSFNTSTYHDVATVCLFVATKNEETIKKLRDIIAVVSQVRNMQLNSEQAENYRRRIIGLEIKLMETIAFDFRIGHVEEYLVKFSKTLSIPKEITYTAWLFSYDTYQLDIALKAPASSIAVALLELACKLEKFHVNINYRELFVNMEAVNETKVDLLDFYISNYNYSFFASIRPELHDTFMDLKIALGNVKQLVEREKRYIEEDAYFDERSYTTGERRFMLGNQRKRLYNEM